MRRREFIAGLGSAAAAWPLAAKAQSRPPVVGFLDPRSPDGMADRLRAFRQGLKEGGYVEGENLAVEYRWAENQMDRLPGLAADLVARQVAVIVTPGGVVTTMAAKSATTLIPIVFIVGEDPVRLGLVTSLSRPGGNLTGVNFLNTELTAKRLDLLREMLPTAKRAAVLVNPANVSNTETTLKDIEPAARAKGFNSKLSTPERRAKSTMHLRRSRAHNPMRCSSGLTRFSMAAESRSYIWPRITESRRRMGIGTLPTLAGL